MSRSYRKHFWFPTEGHKKNKKSFNRKLRHEQFGNGNEYKKMHNSRNIHSWWIYYPNEEAFVRECVLYGGTEEEARKTWHIHFRAK